MDNCNEPSTSNNRIENQVLACTSAPIIDGEDCSSCARNKSPRSRSVPRDLEGVSLYDPSLLQTRRYKDLRDARMILGEQENNKGNVGTDRRDSERVQEVLAPLHRSMEKSKNPGSVET